MSSKTPATVSSGTAPMETGACSCAPSDTQSGLSARAQGAVAKAVQGARRNLDGDTPPPATGLGFGSPEAPLHSNSVTAPAWNQDLLAMQGAGSSYDGDAQPPEEGIEFASITEPAESSSATISAGDQDSSSVMTAAGLAAVGVVVGLGVAAGCSRSCDPARSTPTPNKRSAQAAALAESRALAASQRGIGDVAKAARMQASGSRGEEQFGANCRGRLRESLQRSRQLIAERNDAPLEGTSLSRGRSDGRQLGCDDGGGLPECRAQVHCCIEDAETGCSSCSRTCHKDCRSILCVYTPCAFCLSYGVATHAGSEVCLTVQCAEGCHECGRFGCFVSSPECSSRDPGAADQIAGEGHNIADTRTSPTVRSGNQCFINASITALFACPPVRQLLSFLAQSHWETAVANETGDIAAASMEQRLAMYIAAASMEQRLALTYRDAMLLSSSGKPFVPWIMWYSHYKGEQEDAQEFLADLLDFDNSPRLHSMFVGRLRPQFVCPDQSCAGATPVAIEGVEDFTCLPLPIAGEISLQHALNSFLDTAEPVTAAWSCQHCGNSDPQTRKRNALTQSPPVLCLQLKRFTTSFVEGSGGTASQEYLTHRVHCEEYLLVNHVRYCLIARVYHSGPSMHVGHYFTVCRHELPAGRWWYYNDTVRRLATAEDDLGDDSLVYLCFYERM